MAFFVSLPEVAKIWSQGSTRSSVRLKEGIDVDLRVVATKSYGSALQYFTGSKEHNIVTRKTAISKGLKLNEYGVFRGAKFLVGKNEKEVYRMIGLDWVEPEMRENNGEIELAKKIGFAVETNDYFDGSQNKCGIYSLQLKIDGELYFSYKLDKFT